MKLKKTYIQAFASGCPKQFQDVYILRKYELPRTPPMLVGQSFHDWAFKFFDLVKWEELQEYRTYDDIVQYLRLFIPKVVEEIVPPLKDAMLNFCNFEAKHYLAAKDLGPEFFFPLEREFLIDTPTIETHIDRIDKLNVDNYVCVMEYKLMRSWHVGTFRYLRRELVFYTIALNAIEKYKRRGRYISAYNPLLDKFFFEPVHRNTVAAVIRWIYRLKDATDTGDFPRKPSPRCVTCPGAQECFLENDRVPEPVV